MALLDPDRLFPTEPAARGLARALYAEVRDLPIISPHGHTDPRWYAENLPFPDPAQLFVVPDHYVFRMLLSQGVPLADLGVPRADGGPTETDGRAIWRRFAENYHLLRGTPSRLWLDHTFETVFGLDDAPLGRDRRRHLRPHRRLPRPAGVPAARAVRALRHRGDRHHREPARRPALAPDDPRRRAGTAGSSPPTAPTRWSTPSSPGFAANVARLGEITGCDTATWDGYLEAHRDAPRLLQGARRHQQRPRPRHRPHRGPAAGRGRGAVRQGAGRRRPPPRRPTPSAARC